MNNCPVDITVETVETGREERKLLFRHIQRRVQGELVGEVREELKAKAGAKSPEDPLQMGRDSGSSNHLTQHDFCLEHACPPRCVAHSCKGASTLEKHTF